MDPAENPTLMRSVTDVLEAREWVADAACAVAPNDRLTWLIEPGCGFETPSTVSKLLEICSSCPVRTACLEDALASDVSLVGVWGGTTGTERRATVRAVRADHKIANASLWSWPLPDGRVATSRATGAGITIGAKAIAIEAARRLEASFDQRLEGWRAKAEERTRELEVSRAS